jgi:acetate kinase
MAKIILAINAGSSSVKISVYKAEAAGQNPTQIAEAQVAGLTAPPATFDYKRGSEKIKGQEIKGECSQEEAFEYIVKHLEEDQDLPEVSHRDDIHYACHRVVHGGDYPNHRVIDRSTYHHLQELTDLAPLHNKGALAICRACHELCPKAKNIAQFDSSFHQTIPEATRTYLIDPEVAKKNSLRKYGFHGISYAFITRKVAQYLQKDISELNIIALHLGSGASVCAIKDGKSLDTSMGLTPLDGLPGATRSGAVDPCVAFHLAPSGNKEMHISEVGESLEGVRVSFTDFIPTDGNDT